MADTVHQLVHGYDRGHRLLAGSLRLGRGEAELVTRLSDLSGGLARGEALVPYLSAYPLPSHEYYAVAKTWPDPLAPRAGCVLTHTLLVPTETWRKAADPRAFSALLQHPQRDVSRLEALRVSNADGGSDARAISPPEAGLDDFIAKFFGEGIRPLVWFDARRPQEVMWSLLAAAWPALRAELSFCTFALQPRSLDDRPFDVMFVPGSSRSRFVEYFGAHEVSAATPENVEPWAEKWRLRILGGQLDSDGWVSELCQGLAADPSSIRKVFLFSDLRKRAETSPLAAIGALDVLESLGAITGEVRHRISDLVTTAIEGTVDAPAMWALEMMCLVGLRLDRTDRALIEPEVERLLAQRVQDCVERAPDDAMQLASQFLARDAGRLPHSLVLGISYALASGRDDQLFQSLSKADGVGPAILEVLPQAVVSFASSGRRFGHPWAGVLEGWYRATSSPSTRRILRSILIPEIRSADAAPLLLELLRDVETFELGELCPSLWPNVVSREVGRLFTDFVGERIDADMVERLPEGRPSRQTAGAYILAGAAPLSQSGILQAARQEGGGFLAALIADRALRRAPPPWLRDAAMDPELWKALLQDIEDEVVSSILVQLVGVLERSAICRVSQGEVALARAPEPVQVHAVRSILFAHLVGAAPVGELQRWLATPWATSTIGRNASMLRTVISDGTSPQSRPSVEIVESWLASWRTLEVVNGLALDIGGLSREICALLLWRRPSPWPAEATAIWLRLLTNDRCDTRAREEQFAQALRFCFDNTRLPLGPIVGRVFATVHAAALRDQERRSWDFFGLTGWDKGSELRRRLVDSFLGGSWEPEWFVLAADDSWLLRKICKRMLRQWRGQGFLERALEALREGPPTPLVRELSEILRDPDYTVDWD